MMEKERVIRLILQFPFSGLNRNRNVITKWKTVLVHGYNIRTDF